MIVAFEVDKTAEPMLEAIGVRMEEQTKEDINFFIKRAKLHKIQELGYIFAMEYRFDPIKSPIPYIALAGMLLSTIMQNWIGFTISFLMLYSLIVTKAEFAIFMLQLALRKKGYKGKLKKVQIEQALFYIASRK